MLKRGGSGPERISIYDRIDNLIYDSIDNFIYDSFDNFIYGSIYGSIDNFIYNSIDNFSFANFDVIVYFPFFVCFLETINSLERSLLGLPFILLNYKHFWESFLCYSIVRNWEFPRNQS